MRRGLFISWSALALLGCPETPPSPPTPPDLGVVPPPQPVTRTATITRIELPTPGACADGPAWLKLQPCELDEVVYAVGQADLGYNESLARSTAADRARRAMGVAISDAKATSVVLKGCEVPYLYQCEKVIYAMAKMPKAGTQKLPACDATQVTATLKGSETCPAWTQRLAYKEGADLVGRRHGRGLAQPQPGRTNRPVPGPLQRRPLVAGRDAAGRRGLQRPVQG